MSQHIKVLIGGNCFLFIINKVTISFFVSVCLKCEDWNNPGRIEELYIHQNRVCGRLGKLFYLTGI